MDYKAINLTSGLIFAFLLANFYLEVRMALIYFIRTALKQMLIGHLYILPA